MSLCGAEGSVREKPPLLLLPELLGYGAERSYLSNESFTSVTSVTHSSTDTHLFPEDTQVWRRFHDLPGHKSETRVRI